MNGWELEKKMEFWFFFRIQNCFEAFPASPDFKPEVMKIKFSLFDFYALYTRYSETFKCGFFPKENNTQSLHYTPAWINSP